MEFHPLADLFPLMTADAFQVLCDDIARYGMREPVVLYEGKILDGRNRFAACQVVGREVWTRTYEGDDPLGYVVSLNLHRRHLDESQRAMVAARIATMRQGRPCKTPPIDGKSVSQPQAAALLNVSERSVERAAKVQREGVPDLALAVDRGQVSVSAAAVLAEQPPEIQDSVLGEALSLAREHGISGSWLKRAVERKIAVTEGRPAIPEVAPLPAGRYSLILADPPWRYDFSNTSGRAVEQHYPTMDLDSLCALPVQGLAADSAVLFLWATMPKLPEAFRVISSWGFTYKTGAIWRKSGLGMGYYFRIDHELLLVATIGEPGVPIPENRVSSVIEAPKGQHSAKPVEFYELIERMYPAARRIELFSRCPRQGWDAWGNEVSE